MNHLFTHLIAFLCGGAFTLIVSTILLLNWALSDKFKEQRQRTQQDKGA
jgi:hypothetical protein